MLRAMMAEVNERMVDVPGGSVFVRRWEAGAGDRAPIVLLHDSLGSVELWRHFPEALAAATHRAVIAYDRLGFGKSTARTEPPSLEFIREEAEVYFPALRRGLGLSRYVLFGHSVGGGMALVIAATQEGCEAVITESAQSFVEARTCEGIRVAKEDFGKAEQFAKLAKLHGEKARWVLDAWTETWLAPEYASWNLDEYLAKVRYPVMAIHGDEDEFGSVEFPKRIVSGVKGRAELAVLEGCGHVPHRAMREEVLRRTAEFLGEMG